MVLACVSFVAILPMAAVLFVVLTFLVPEAGPSTFVSTTSLALIHCQRLSTIIELFLIWRGLPPPFPLASFLLVVTQWAARVLVARLRVVPLQVLCVLLEVLMQMGSMVALLLAAPLVVLE